MKLENCHGWLGIGLLTIKLENIEIFFFTLILKRKYVKKSSTYNVSLVNAVKIELTRLHARISQN